MKSNYLIYDASMLNIAVSNNELQQVEDLIKEGTDVNFKGLGGTTALHVAADFNSELDIVNVLLQGKAEVNIKDDNDWTPLHYAVANNSYDIISVLINKGADVTAACAKSLLDLAFKYESYESAAALINAGADIDDAFFSITRGGGSYIVSPLKAAIMKNRLDIVEAIICKNSNLVKGTASNYGYCNPLKNAVDEGHLEIVKVLIAAGADVNAINEIGGSPPLHLAVLQGYLDIVKVLLKVDRVDVNAKGGGYNCPEPVLHRAVIEGRLEIVQALLEADGIDVNAEGGYGGETALQRAVIEGRLEIVQALLEADGIDVNAEGGYGGETALQRTVIGGNIDIVKALIAAGADVNAKNKEGKTALSLAASYGRYAITLFLLTGKAKGFLAKNIVPIVTFLSLVVVGLLAAHFVPQVFLFLTGPLLGSLGLIHNLPVLQVTVLSLIVSLGSILVGSLVSRFDGNLDSVGQNHLVSGELNYGTGNKAAPTAVADTGKNPSVLEEGKGNNVQASVAPPQHINKQ